MESNIWADRIRVFVLVFLVSLSLFFTYHVWKHPVSDGKANETNTQIEPKEKSNVKKVFLASQVIYHETDKAEVLFGNNITVEIQNIVSKLSFGKMEGVEEFSDEEYISKIKTPHQIELSYPYQLSVADYIKFFSLDLKTDELAKEEFNRVILELNNQRLVFYNDSTKTRLSFSTDIPQKKITSLVNEESLIKLSARLKPLENRLIYLYQDEITLNKYNYIYGMQTQNVFKTMFLGKNNEIKTLENVEETIYIGTGTDRLSVNEKTGVVKFKEINNTPKTLTDSLTYLKQLNTELPNLRLFDRTENWLHYRVFIEGLPIISTDYKGELAFSLEQKKRVQSVMTNLEVIQVPIPTDATVTLESAEQMLSTVNQKNSSLEISDICIGYSWHYFDSNTQVVELVPEWFVKYENQWHAVSTIE